MSNLDDRLYAAYRRQLHRTHGKPTRETRKVHRLEYWLYFWPMWAYKAIQLRRLSKAKTTQPLVNEDA